MILLPLLLAAGQTDSPVCVGSNDTIDCRSPDGSTYIERRIGSQIIRKGIDSNGQSWTEYVTPIFDGTRTVGTDSSGRSWTQQCNPRFGTTGIDRNGQPVFVPPPRPVPAQNGQTPLSSCG